MSTIILVYFCLNAEKYQWQWISLISGASTVGYVFCTESTTLFSRQIRMVSYKPIGHLAASVEKSDSSSKETILTDKSPNPSKKLNDTKDQ